MRQQLILFENVIIANHTKFLNLYENPARWFSSNKLQLQCHLLFTNRNYSSCNPNANERAIKTSINVYVWDYDNKFGNFFGCPVIKQRKKKYDPFNYHGKYPRNNEWRKNQPVIWDLFSRFSVDEILYIFVFIVRPFHRFHDFSPFLLLIKLAFF